MALREPALDSIAALVVGARFACFRCRLRTHLLACPQCHAPTLDLDAPLAQRSLLALARRAPRARSRAPATDPLFARYGADKWLFALASAGAAAYFGRTIKTQGFVPVPVVMALCAMLGFVAGLIVFALLGAVILGALWPLVRRALPRAKPPPVVALLRAPAEIEPVGEGALEGVLANEHGDVAIASDLAGALVGARGVSCGADLADACVPGELRVLGEAGETARVVMEVGSVCVAGGGRDVVLGDGAPRAWGIVRSPAGVDRASVPRAEWVTVWTVPNGARVRIEGGARDEAGVLRGTRESPVRVTVLEA